MVALHSCPFPIHCFPASCPRSLVWTLFSISIPKTLRCPGSHNGGFSKQRKRTPLVDHLLFQTPIPYYLTITFSYVTHEDICNCFNGDTLLAIQAPSGTQLEVPIPEMGQNGQKKYQINLKSHSGPIHVLLINKESSSSKPVVFPVPPPDDLTQPSSQSSTPVTPQKPNIAAQNLPEQLVSERSQNLQQIPATEISSAGSLSGDIIDELMSSDVFPLLRLSPTPADDYNFNLDDNEGVCDLFDVQILNY
ncbi:transcription factor E2F5 isoform X4 [Ictidomys tridecemlineatus]